MSEKITIDGREYDFEALSERAKGAIASIQYCDERVRQLSSEWAVADTARMAYNGALSRELKSN